MRPRTVVRAQVREVVARCPLRRELPVCSEGTVLHHVRAATVVLLRTDAASAQAGTAVRRIPCVVAHPHPAFALCRARRPAQVGPTIAVRALVVTQVWVGNDPVCAALKESGNRNRFLLP